MTAVARTARWLRQFRKSATSQTDNLLASHTKRLLSNGQVRQVARMYPLLLLFIPLSGILRARWQISLADLFLLVADAFFMLRQDHRAQRAIARAEVLYERAASQEPSNSAARKNLCRIYYYREQYDTAIAVLVRMEDEGLGDADTVVLLGRIHAEQDDLVNAKRCFETALQRDSKHRSAHLSLSNLLPFLGDFRGKWQAYDRVSRRVPHHPGSKPWRGEPLEGQSICIFPVSGIGDEIRYAALYDRLIGMAERCTIMCEPRLASLFQRTFSRARVLALARRHTFNVSETRIPGRGPIPEGDFYTINLSAIQFLVSSPEDCKAERFLVPDTAMAARWRSELASAARGRMLVGMDWKSGLMMLERRREYMDLIQWQRLLSTEGVLFVSLCYAGDEELTAFAQETGIEILRPQINLRDDFENLSALISSMDLVISAPTSTAELAGFLDVPTWLVESSPAVHYRWRGGPDGSDIWFRSIRHFNAHHNGGKDANLRKVTAELQHVLRGWPTHSRRLAASA